MSLADGKPRLTPAPRAAQATLGRERVVSVLLADDNRVLCEAVANLLRLNGYVVYPAHDGLGALRLARKLRPDCLVLDVLLPGLTGAKLCWLIRQDPDLRETHIVVFSSLCAQDFRWFPEMSADAYVAKSGLPGAGENLLRALRGLADTSRNVVEHGILGFGQMRARHVVRGLLEDRAWKRRRAWRAAAGSRLPTGRTWPPCTRATAGPWTARSSAPRPRATGSPWICAWWGPTAASRGSLPAEAGTRPAPRASSG